MGQLTDGLAGVPIPAREPRWWERIDRMEPDSPRRRTGDVGTSHRQVVIGHQRLRVDVRAGHGTGTPLVMCGGIGASFELLQPLVDALDPGIDIIRFDAPQRRRLPGRRAAPRVPAAGPDTRADAR